MRNFYGYIIITLAACLGIFQFSNAANPSVVISMVQLGDSVSATNEIIEIYNNSDTQIDITGWCLYYASSSSDQNGSKMVCLNVENNNVHLFLPAYSSVLFASNQLILSNPGFLSDYVFSATLSGTAGYIRLINKDNIVVDKIGWGIKAVLAENYSPTSVPAPGKVLGRKILNDKILQDIDDNLEDFEIRLPYDSYNYGLIYEVYDICSNIDDIQLDVPDGYLSDDYGVCSLPPVDVCSNLDGIQEMIPENYWQDVDGGCQIDLCINIDDVQQLIPDGYVDVNGECYLDLSPIIITEFLPNVIGSDIGNEFIEIYNPNDTDIDLVDYVLNINGTSYDFIAGSVIESNQYFIINNKDINYSLNNTKGVIRILSIDDRIIDSTDYESTVIGESWAVIDSLWQYTNQLTPGLENKPSLYAVVEDLIENQIQLCADNQYVNPTTGRCKLIKSSVSVLAPCKDGQYRSEETNRCRNIAADIVSLVPCAEGQERNPETNRCRNITTTVLGASDLVPCKEGQERNLETNRCRNIISNIIPQVDYAPSYVGPSSENNVLWLSIYGVGAVAVIYGVWEWRYEINGQIRKLGQYLKSGK